MSTQIVDQKKKKSDGIPTWMIAGGIAAVFAVFTASAVYYIKTSRKKQMRDARYGADYHPEGNFESKLTKYWNLTVNTWKAAKTLISNALAKNKPATPLVDVAAATTAMDPYNDEGIL